MWKTNFHQKSTALIIFKRYNAVFQTRFISFLAHSNKIKKYLLIRFVCLSFVQTRKYSANALKLNVIHIWHIMDRTENDIRISTYGRGKFSKKMVKIVQKTFYTALRKIFPISYGLWRRFLCFIYRISRKKISYITDYTWKQLKFILCLMWCWYNFVMRM